MVLIKDIINKERSNIVSFSFYKESYDFDGLANENESSFSSSLDSVEENTQGSNWLTSSLKVKKSVVHKRKGVPQRAPLC